MLKNIAYFPCWFKRNLSLLFKKKKKRKNVSRGLNQMVGHEKPSWGICTFTQGNTLLPAMLRSSLVVSVLCTLACQDQHNDETCFGPLFLQTQVNQRLRKNDPSDIETAADMNMDEDSMLLLFFVSFLLFFFVFPVPFE